MSIIDAHLHIFKYKEHWSEWAAKRWIQEMPDKYYWYTKKDLVPEDFNCEYQWTVEMMDKSGVDKAILLGNWQTPHEIKVPTSYIKEAVDTYPDRFFAFAAPDPLGGWDSVKELEDAYSHKGFYGIKLLPTYNYVPPTDKRIWPLYELTAAKNKRVIIHTGFGPISQNRLTWQEPYALEELLVSFPDLKISMGHTGYHRFMDAACLMSKNPNLYGDLAYWYFLPIDYVARSLVFAKSLGVLNRIMWGTDFPHIDPKADQAKLKRLVAYCKENHIEPYITEDDLKGLFGENAKKFLDID